MTLATIKGRLQTKAAAYVILAAVTVVFVWVKGGQYVALFAVAVAVGLVLEAIWGYFIDHEPGWLTFSLAAVEFMAISAIATLARVPITLAEAASYYVISWILIQLIFIYLVPIWRLKYTSEGSELF